MKKIIAYQVVILFILCFVWTQGQLGNFPAWLRDYQIVINCMIISTLAGVLYCIRAIYLSRSVRKDWDINWEIWYYLRPISSSISGLIAYIFLKAGLIILEANQTEDAGHFGYLAFAFIAGFNVDNFLKRIENLAKSSFGIEISRSSGKSENDN